MLTKPKGQFYAEISKDEEVQSTVISLHYDDHNNPEQSLTASIAPELGSNMFLFRVGEHNIIYCDQETLKKKGFTGNFVLWPFPNRVTDKKYTYRGHDYSLADRACPSGNYSLVHGLVFDRSWNYEEPEIKQDGVSVTTFVEMQPGSPYFAGYPFPSRLSLTYTLTKSGLEITYQVENKGTTPLPFGFALHPYLSLLSGTEQTYVSMPATTVMEADQEMLPTGRILNVTSEMYAMFDLRQPQAVGNLKLDHVYTDLTPHRAAVIEYRTLNLQLDITTTDDFTHAVIYTPSAPEREKFFCLEHQTCSTDAINLHNRGEELSKVAHLLEVSAGEKYTGTLTYTITHK